MTEEEQMTKNEILALLFRRAAEMTREPIVFDDAETTDDTTKN